MPELVLHIGTHKTGTSSIQRFCKVYQSQLQTAGVYWPTETLPVSSAQHSALGKMLSEGQTDEVKSYLERVKLSAAQAGCERIFLSGERLSIATPEDVEHLNDIAAMDIRVVVYFRNVYDNALATLNQLIRVGRHHLKAENLVQTFQKRFNYAGIISTWEQAVGAENVSVHSYDLHKQDLLQHLFSSALGIQLTKNAGHTERRNTSFDLNMMINVVLGEFPTDTTPLKKIYQSGHTKELFPLRYQTAQYYQLARIIVEMVDPDLTHPKLAPFHKQLTSFKKVQNTDEDRKTYFLAFAKMIQDYYGE